MPIKKTSGDFSTLRMSLAARVATFPVTALAGIATTYILIRSYGPESFGTISLLATLFLLIPFADFGMGAPLMNGVANSNQTSAEKAHLVARVFWILAATSISLSGAAIFSTVILDWSEILGNKSFEPHQFENALLVTVLIFLASIPFGTGHRILIGLGLNHVSVIVAGSSGLCALLVTAAITESAAPPPYAAAAPSLGILISALLSFIFALRKLGIKFRSLLSPGDLAALSLFKSSGPMFVVMLAVPLAFQSHRILISRYSTVAELASYSIAMQMYIPVWSLVSTTAVAMWPIFAKNRHDNVGSGSTYYRALLAFSLSGILIAGVFLLFGPVFAHIVSGGQIELPLPLLLSMGGLVFVQCVQQVPGMFLTSDRGLAFQAISVSLMCIAALVLGSLSAGPYGACGPLIATALAVLVFQVVPGLLMARKSLHELG
ncbi:hypothetical protein AB0O58_02790 [Rhodococcus sp. NPDC080181]|uniref:lipopolysaccharide biosynthesis protein n=1 Tax=Rhodococcus sp. NPDC080181 TaxID=3155292 RepID=UPI00344B4D9B